MITDEDYYQVAETLIRRHGANAVLWADLAIDDLASKGEEDSAGHWRSLREVICDLVSTNEKPAEMLLN